MIRNIFEDGWHSWAVGQSIVDVNDEIKIAVLRELEINCHVTGFHVYKTDWIPFISEMLPAEMERTNI